MDDVNPTAKEAPKKRTRKKAVKAPPAAQQHPETNYHAPAIPEDIRYTSLSIIPLGGACEIGKNMTVYEQGDDIIVVDCGLMFPGEEQLGVDVVIPDITYLLEHKDKVRAILLTHGHEDHIGALPYVLAQLPVPIYTRRLTMGLIKSKLDEYDMWPSTDAHEVEDGEIVTIGSFTCQFIHVAHSIPDACSIAIRTEMGTIIQTSDFKFDQTPVDNKPSDYASFSRYGDEGVLALVCDTTNVVRAGHTPSERTITPVLDDIFRTARGRIIIASFASNINRLQQVISMAEKHGRKVALAGRSMEQNVRIARGMDYITAQESTIIPLAHAENHPANEICVLTTGSQGEPLSALSRMATDEHKKIHIDPGDTIVLSSTPIPGNEDSVYRTVNNLFRLGANVIYSEQNKGVHVSGHGSRDEITMMVNLTRPKYLVPVHGEYRHVVTFGRMAFDLGYKQEEILTPEVGDILEFTDEGADIVGRVPTSGSVMVDGIGVGDVGEVVLRDRRHLADEGVVIVTLGLDSSTGEVVSGPDIVSRGFVIEAESEDLYERAKEVVIRELATIEADFTGDWSVVKTDLRRALNKFFRAETRRQPMVLPVIVEV
ncbi:MAG TPA: ribonuclease J [Armatimonadota bacterium]|jgi:ribonuclease J